MIGGLHTDYLDGGPGGDFLSGSGGADQLYGGGGFDTFSGGSGQDEIDGKPERIKCGRDNLGRMDLKDFDWNCGSFRFL